MCLSFWLGLIVGFFFGPFSWYNILNGFFYSATSWLLWCLTLYLGNGYDPSRVHNILFPDGIKIINNNEKE
ncbi:MAG: hypothetical protein NZZ41_03875 [Candidatus Dojkabacteria bacterium]|nr:hypothetical protein [Candidatus Dojkabacteria bacterium]